jgi:hypothetical protein
MLVALVQHYSVLLHLDTPPVFCFFIDYLAILSVFFYYFIISGVGLSP